MSTLVVSNGTNSLVKNRLVELNEHHPTEVLVTDDTIYLNSFGELLAWANKNHLSKITDPVVFMFFNGVDYTSEFVAELIEHHRHPQLELAAAFLYFDSSVATPDVVSDPYKFLKADTSVQFLTLATIASDVLRHLSLMVDRIAGIYFDDTPTMTPSEPSLLALMRNHPKLERINLTPFQSLVMRGFV